MIFVEHVVNQIGESQAVSNGHQHDLELFAACRSLCRYAKKSLADVYSGCPVPCLAIRHNHMHISELCLFAARSTMGCW